MKEALLYERLEEEKVRCKVCPHRCVIANGKKGICAVKENRGGTLYAINYGKTVASGVDPIEKKPLYEFLSGSKAYSLAADGCNMECPWCQNFRISQGPKSEGKLEGFYVPPEDHVELAKMYACQSIAYTYSEPTIYIEYALDIMKLAKKEGLKNVWVSNGYTTTEALEKILPYLDAANIDFKGPDDEVYATYCKGKSGPVFETMRRLKNAGVHLEVTTLVIPDVNDSDAQLQSVAEAISEIDQNIPWHISRFFPGWKMRGKSPTPLSTLHKAQEFGKSCGLTKIYLGNV